MNWNEYFINMAGLVSTKSKDRSTKVGCVIVGEDNEVLSTGFNGFPRNTNDENESYHERPLKYSITEHAERNAIFNAARQGIRLKNSVMYLQYAPAPCINCTRAIIQSGIVAIVMPTTQFPGVGTQWKDEMMLSCNLLRECGIRRYIFIDGNIYPAKFDEIYNCDMTKLGPISYV